MAVLNNDSWYNCHFCSNCDCVIAVAILIADSYWYSNGSYGSYFESGTALVAIMVANSI